MNPRADRQVGRILHQYEKIQRAESDAWVRGMKILAGRKIVRKKIEKTESLSIIFETGGFIEDPKNKSVYRGQKVDLLIQIATGNTDKEMPFPAGFENFIFHPSGVWIETARKNMSAAGITITNFKRNPATKEELRHLLKILTAVGKLEKDTRASHNPAILERK